MSSASPSALSSLSSSQQSQLHHFMAVVNLQDAPQALSILVNHNWNLEEAVGNALIMGPTAPHAASTAAASSSSSSSSSLSSSLSSPSRPALPPLSTATSTPTQYAAVSPSSSPTRSLLSPSSSSSAAPSLNAASSSRSSQSAHPSSSSSSSGSGSQAVRRRPAATQGYSAWLDGLPFGWLLSGAVSFLSQLLAAILPASWYHTAPASAAAAASSSSSSSSSTSASSSSISSSSAAASFHSEFMRQHPLAPPFLPSSYLSAVRQSKQQHKPLFIYLHSPSAPAASTSAFLSSLLCTETVHNFVQQNFVAWMGNTASNPDAARLAHDLRVRAFPFIALLASMNNQLAVMYRREGGLQPGEAEGAGAEAAVDSLIHSLLVKMEQYEALTAEERRRQDGLREGRLVRETQDREYQEALRADKEAMRKRQAEEEQKRQEEDERKRQAAEAEAAEQKERERRQQQAGRRRSLLSSLPPEPAPSPTTVAVSVRMLDGKKISRRWDETVRMSSLFDWIDGQERPESADEPAELMRKEGGGQGGGAGQLRVVSNFPRRLHTDGSVTLKSLGLGKQVLLYVEEIVEEEQQQ